MARHSLEDALYQVHIFLVLPDDARREELTFALKSCGAVVVPLQSLDAAVRHGRQVRPDVALIDTRAPDQHPRSMRELLTTFRGDYRRPLIIGLDPTPSAALRHLLTRELYADVLPMDTEGRSLCLAIARWLGRDVDVDDPDRPDV